MSGGRRSGRTRSCSPTRATWLPRRVWQQFADPHDLTGDGFEALRSVHDAVRAAAADRGDAALGERDDRAMVLLKA